MEKVNLAEKFKAINAAYDPKIVGALNGQLVKLARFEGPYIWHSHEEEDELFLVISGCIKIELRDRIITLNEGEFFIVKKGVEHRPIAKETAQVLLFEPEATVNTGDVEHAYTKTPGQLERI